jgi:hypothetical protein
MKKVFSALFVLLTSLHISAQGGFIPMGSDAYHIIDRLDIKYGKIIPIQHTSDKQYHRGNIARAAETLRLSNVKFNKVQEYQIQWLIDDNVDWLDSVSSKTNRPLFKVLYREPASFAHVSSKKKGLWDLRFNPVFDLKMGVETEGTRFIFTSSRGLEVRGNLKRVLSFYFNVTGNAARPQGYVTDRIRKGEYRNVPGQAYWKDYDSKIFKFDDGIDFFDARGYVNVHVLKHINMSFGRDKFFIGNGQRSFFLSDFSAPYLFLKLDMSFWRFKYQTIFAELNTQYVRGADQLLPKKYMAVHHLSLQANRFFNIGIFEGVTLNRSKQFELQYLNPLIFYRAVEHAIGSPDNVLVGLDYKVNFANHVSIYGQFVLDEFNFKNFFKRNGWWANKWAMQAGIKYIDIIPNLDAQAEFNMARPFMYTHQAGNNFTHYNQPLTHPLGANFYEFILQLRYQPIAPLTLNAKLIIARVGEDTLINGALSNYGGDIFRYSRGPTVTREFGNNIGQGASGTISYFQFLTTYQPWHNVYFDFELLYRAKTSKKPQDETSIALLNNRSSFFIGFGARMNIGFKRNEF